MLKVGTFAQNARDVGKVVVGYAEARRMLKKVKPDGILIKGGYVAVPVGLAAAHLGIPFITHDSDVTPGLANRIIAKWARKHATGMPTEYYSYPKGTMQYTGVPISTDFKKVSKEEMQDYRKQLGLEECKQVVAVIGGSQGGQQLNDDFVLNAGRVMQAHPGLGIVHIVGPAHVESMQRKYSQELLVDEQRRVIVVGFVSDVYRYTGAADIVVSRASATVIAELAVQGKAVILVPGQLADDHQTTNARHLAESDMVLVAAFGDAEALATHINTLLVTASKREKLGQNLHTIARPHAAQELARLVYEEFRAGDRDGAKV